MGDKNGKRGDSCSNKTVATWITIVIAVIIACVLLGHYTEPWVPGVVCLVFVGFLAYYLWLKCGRAMYDDMKEEGDRLQRNVNNIGNAPIQRAPTRRDERRRYE